MSTDFKIIFESTFSFKGGKLYVLLLRDGDRFAVEVDSLKESFGRKYFNNKKDANDAFKDVNNRLSSFKILIEAEKFMCQCFSFDSVDKFKFALLVFNRVISQDDIVSLRKTIDFRTRIKIDYLRNIKKENALTVYVYLGSEKKAFGVLTGTREARDLIFQLL